MEESWNNLAGIFMIFLAVIVFLAGEFPLAIFLVIIAYFAFKFDGGDIERRLDRPYKTRKEPMRYDQKYWIDRRYIQRTNVIPQNAHNLNWTHLDHTMGTQFTTSIIHTVDVKFDPPETSSNEGLIITTSNPRELDLNSINYQDYQILKVIILEAYPGQHYQYSKELSRLIASANISIRSVLAGDDHDRILHDSYCVYGPACHYN